MKDNIIRIVSWTAIVVLIVAAVTPQTTALAHDGDFQHYKSHFYTQKKANNRFVIQRFAVVDSSGNLVRGDRVVSAQRSSAGVYRVTFNREVAECAFNVTPLAENGALPIRFASASTGAVWGPETVGVAIFSSGGNLLDGGFSITMTCG
ncbi:MAG: hypothetical protein GY720_17495 [bacterium]|nr:hypothetical protein [bacterium]